ncbi:MAG: glutamine amidotransferase [Campylobacteraceae bacterium]|jgi:GMP synthase (glutamine-hydrolysing)|nr:glutamine amidotransferase [Campylobacteraceae bacterium]
MFVILKMGDTFRSCAAKYGDFEQWTIGALGDGVSAIVVDPKKEPFPPLADIDGIVITGSHDMVTDRLLYMEKSSEWLKAAAAENIPIFGVCFGHQLLAQTFGGVVEDHPDGPEIGTVSINLTDEAKNDPLFKDLPETFLAHATHTQSVSKLPTDALLLAANCYEKCHAFRIGKFIWGVQFHPEHSTDIIKEYIAAQADNIKDLPIVLREVCATPYANGVLKKFASFCLDKP